MDTATFDGDDWTQEMKEEVDYIFQDLPFTLLPEEEIEVQVSEFADWLNSTPTADNDA